MRSIKALPEAVYSSVRSGIILFDLTRVVEELVFNSLDAGATKVSIAVGVGTCYIKVTDNGYGITRDGLVLLGERYATSKFEHLADLDTVSGSFGFRGEALGSISDVSLLEIVTKAHGMPNGYHKVIKGCKCLYLGIDDNRQDVGTTVIVRDLFYNQPVRRKHLQSSPKRVLHSVKECILRIALVHLKISFKIIDIESGDELLCTSPSTSPLPLLMSGFGVEVSSSLQELGVSEGVLKLSGYISGPSETISVKAFQYFYINSRFISKGPIHKLLNQLSARFSCSEFLKADIESQSGKRSRSQTYPTYILNLSCPRAQYDLTFEPSKTYAEFKDWDPVLAFVEKAVTCFWSKSVSYENSLSHGADMSHKKDIWKEADTILSTTDDLEENYGFSKRRCITQCQQVSRGLVSPQPKILKEEPKHMSASSNSKFSCEDALQVEEHGTAMSFAFQTDYSLKSCDGSLAQCKATVPQMNGSHLGIPDRYVSSVDDLCFENTFFRGRSDEHVDHLFRSTWDDASLGTDSDTSNGLRGRSKLSADSFRIVDDIEKDNEHLKKHFLRSCSSRTALLPDWACIASDDVFGFKADGFRTKKKLLNSDDRVDIGEVDDNNQEVTVWSSPRITTTCNMDTGSGLLSKDSLCPLPLTEGCLDVESNLQLEPVSPVQYFGSSCWSSKSDWSPFTLDPILIDKRPDVECFVDEDAFERQFKYHRNAVFDHSADTEGKDDIFSCDTVEFSSPQEDCLLPSYFNTSSSRKGHASCKENIREFREDGILFPEWYDNSRDEPERVYFEPFGKACTHAEASLHMSSLSYVDVEKDKRFHARFEDRTYDCRSRPTRSHSAPPVYRGKKKFFALNNWPTAKAGKSHIETIRDATSLQEARDLKHIKESSGVDHLSLEEGLASDSLAYAREDMKKNTDIAEIPNNKFREDPCLDIYDTDSDHTLKESRGELDFGLKWRDSCSLTARREKPDNLHSQDSILDISSGFLHLSGDSLVPNSISKNFLEDAKVLQQVDRKFITIVAGGTLAIIDQHAADERIRLEELRHKVLSGEMKTITYLDAEQELVLPEIGYQLLYNYAEQIQKWGWICNFHAQSSTSFKKSLNFLHSQQSVATLLAVPCILGVNLTDVDLLEFLQQLADTDGSSAIPPAVLRVLNFKACRGAIMFGDALLPSECSLIVEELKQTSLCFQGTSQLELQDEVQDDLKRATGEFFKEGDDANKLNRILQLTGFSGPVYAEACVTVHHYDILLEVTVINRTKGTLQNLCLELATMGDLKLVERPQNNTLAPESRKQIKATIKVSSPETGVIFGNIVYETSNVLERSVVILNGIHIDIMDYISPAICSDAAFRTMWAEFEWENKVAVNTVISDEEEFLDHIIKSSNMKCLTALSALEGDCGFLAANLYPKSAFGEDALVNLSIEKQADGKLSGYIRIRSKTQGIALSLGDKITLKQKGGS